MGVAVGEAVSEEVFLDREGEPIVLVPSHAMQVSAALLVVGWCCWDAPLRKTDLCSMAHCARADAVVMCQRCRREYGVFANRSAPNGALVVTVR